MAWLYLPESVGLNSESQQPFPMQKPFVMSRGKPMLPQSLLRKWKKEDYMKHLFGLTLQPSTANLGVERWISSQEDSLVNLGVKPGNSKRQTTKDGCGMTLSESFAKLDRNSSSWKTCQVSLTGEFVTFSGRWPRSGSMLNGVVSKHPMLAQTIGEIESSFTPIVPKEGVSFPTPCVADSGSNGKTFRTVAKKSLQEGNWRGLSLPNVVRMFPTPLASDSVKTNLVHQGGNPTLLGAVRMFPTVTVQDSKNNAGRSQNNRNTLPLNAVAGGKLNPQWVEWLMGWPIGWTDLEPAGTELSLSKQQGHSLNFTEGLLGGA